MKIKTISVEIKKSSNYQTYGCSENIEIEEGDNVEEVRREAQARCRKAVMEQITIG